VLLDGHGSRQRRKRVFMILCQCQGYVSDPFAMATIGHNSHKEFLCATMRSSSRPVQGPTCLANPASSLPHPARWRNALLRDATHERPRPQVNRKLSFSIWEPRHVKRYALMKRHVRARAGQCIQCDTSEASLRAAQSSDVTHAAIFGLASFASYCSWIHMPATA
jgi:hypothetical protein